MTLPFFNEINIKSLDEYDQVNTVINGKRLQLDLNFEGYFIAEERITLLKNYLQRLEEHVDKVYDCLAADYQSGDKVAAYINFHLQSAIREDLDVLLEDMDTLQTQTEHLWSKIQLKRIGFYPEIEASFAVFDFIIHEEISQCLLVAKTDSTGGLTGLEVNR